MSFEERMTEFAGLPVAVFPQGPTIPVPDVAAGDVAWRIGIEGTYGEYEAGPGYDSEGSNEYEPIFAAFLERVDVAQVRAIVIAATAFQDEQDTEAAVASLVEAADRFPNLRAVFVGDILREESDVAYIGGPRLNALLKAFPALEVLGVRGGLTDWAPEGPVPLYSACHHERLRSLVIECGGLDAGVLRNVLASEFPNLGHLEFYLGEPHYGGDASVADLAPLLAGGIFPKLRSLGLRDSVIQDEIAVALADAPVVARLETLDLSLGTLGDEGMAALLAGRPLTGLKRLDLHHHFLSDEMIARLRAALPGVDMDLSDRQKADSPSTRNPSGRYIAVSE